MPSAGIDPRPGSGKPGWTLDIRAAFFGFGRNLLKLLPAAFLVAGFSGVALADLRAVTDISEQRMYVVQNGNITDVWRVSTAGQPGCRTPVGRYRPIRLERTWYSSRYDGAPMPHAIFFLGGYAIHGTTETSKLGSPASHGCIRLSRPNARKLFNLVRSYGRANTWIIVRR